MSRSLAVLCLLAAPARAQTQDKALAEALFQDGRELLEKGKLAEACGKFAASQRVEPKLGTLLNLAACHEREGRTASAWAEFTEAMTQSVRSHQPEREQFARDHVTALEKVLSRVTLVVPPGGVQVAIDDVALDPAVVGTELPMDPGTHAIAVTAPGKRAWRTSITVAAGPSVQSVAVPALEDEPAPAPPPAEERREEPPRDTSSGRRTAGWIVLGVGAALAGVGAFYGVRAFAKKDDAQTECAGDVCSQRGLDLFSESRVAANVSTVSFVTAAAAIGVGVFLLLTSNERR